MYYKLRICCSDNVGALCGFSRDSELRFRSLAQLRRAIPVSHRQVETLCPAHYHPLVGRVCGLRIIWSSFDHVTTWLVAELILGGEL